MTLLCRPVEVIGPVTGLHDQLLAIFNAIAAPTFWSSVTFTNNNRATLQWYCNKILPERCHFSTEQYVSICMHRAANAPPTY